MIDTIKTENKDTNNETVVLACETLRAELELVMKRSGCRYPVVWAESGLHSWTEKLHAKVVELLESLEPEFKRVLLLFGFCGNSLVGVQSGERTLVMPFVPDCIPIFLGSRKRQNELGVDTYFLTQGYLRGEKNALREFEYYVKRYGMQRAVKLMKKVWHNYKRFAVVDTGAFDVGEVMEAARNTAQMLEMPVSSVKGNLGLIEDLLGGNWTPDRFLIIPPGERISFEDSLAAGRSQIAGTDNPLEAPGR
jgi:hypothetical protein